MTTVALSEFLRDRTQHITDCTNSVVELAAPWIHYESQDTCLTVSGCLDWRGEILMSALDAHSRAPDIAVGAVHFLILQLGHEPAAEVLAYYGERAAAFAELFDDKWLVDDLDENDHFTAGMPISAVLLVLDATMDPLMPESPLRAWAVAHIAHTMLPTTAGLVAMSSFAPRHPKAGPHAGSSRLTTSTRTGHASAASASPATHSSLGKQPRIHISTTRGPRWITVANRPFESLFSDSVPNVGEIGCYRFR